MTTYTGNVTNGRAEIQIDTKNLTSGNYNIQLKYNTNNKYQESSTSTTLSLTEKQIIELGIGTDTPFTREMIEYYSQWSGTHIAPTITNTGSVDAGRNYKCVFKDYPLVDDFRLTMEVTATNYSRTYFGLSPRLENQYENSVEITSNEVLLLRSNARFASQGINLGGGTHVVVIVCSNGTVTVTADDVVLASFTGWNNTCLMYPSIRQDVDNGFRLNYLSIENLSNGGGGVTSQILSSTSLTGGVCA